MQILLVLCALSLLCTSHAGPRLDLSSLKCSVWDRTCIKKSMQSVIPLTTFGMPDMGIPVLDPMLIPLVKVNQGGLKAEIENIVIRGIAKAIVEKFRVDKYSKQAAVTVVFPELTLNGTYKAAGFIHSQPFNGKGDVYYRASKLEMDMIINYDVREDGNGMKYAELNDYYYFFEVLDGIMVLFNNLYDGDQVHSAAAHNYIQKHWKQLTAEFGRPYLNPVVDRLYNVAKVFLNSIPLNTFSADY